MIITEYIDIVALPTILCGFTVLILGYVKLTRIRRIVNPKGVFVFEIWLTGLIGLLFGFFGQLVRMREGFNAISMAGDISASIVAETIGGSYNYSLRGILVLIVSLIVWGILKSIKMKKEVDL